MSSARPPARPPGSMSPGAAGPGPAGGRRGLARARIAAASPGGEDGALAGFDPVLARPRVVARPNKAQQGSHRPAARYGGRRRAYAPHGRVGV